MRKDKVGFVAGFAFAAALMGWLGTAAFADVTAAGAPACCSDAAAKCCADEAKCCVDAAKCCPDGAEWCKGEDAKCGEAGKCCHHAEGEATTCKAGCCKKHEGPDASAKR